MTLDYTRYTLVCIGLFFSLNTKENTVILQCGYEISLQCWRLIKSVTASKIIMQTKILKVVKSGDVFSVKSEKSETGLLNKRNLVLKELGGKFENEYAVSVLGTAASQEWQEGDLVVVTLRFQTREYNGQVFQDITVTEIYPLNK